MSETKKKKESFFSYKGRPLVRNGNILYYGNMDGSCVAFLQILGDEKMQDLSVGNKVVVQLLSTDTSLRMKERILKKSEKNGLYEALNIASIWLDRAEIPSDSAN